jgi:hypothetical protein
VTADKRVSDAATKEPMSEAPSRDFTVAVTPGQLAGGLAIVAAIFLIVSTAHRRRRERARRRSAKD